MQGLSRLWLECVLNILKTQSQSVNLRGFGLKHFSVWSGDQYVLKNKLVCIVSKCLRTLIVIKNFVLLWHRSVKSFSEHYSRCVNPIFSSLSIRENRDFFLSLPGQQRPASLTKREREIGAPWQETALRPVKELIQGYSSCLHEERRGNDSYQGSEDKHTSEYLTSRLTSEFQRLLDGFIACDSTD